ncbi:MAG: hypothetical protein AB7K37_16305 [Cyclobacteriaceae bacterium]
MKKIITIIEQQGRKVLLSLPALAGWLNPHAHLVPQEVRRPRRHIRI